MTYLLVYLLVYLSGLFMGSLLMSWLGPPWRGFPWRPPRPSVAERKARTAAGDCACWGGRRMDVCGDLPMCGAPSATKITVP